MVIIELLDTLVSCLVAGKGELKGVNCSKICFVQLKNWFPHSILKDKEQVNCLKGSNKMPIV